MTGNATDTAVRNDVVDLLINQHMTIRDLFIEVESATGKAKAEAFHRLVKLLAVHETVEEQLIRPLTRLYVYGGKDIADDRVAEEHDAKETLVALEEMGPDAPEFTRLLSQLRDAVLEHAAKEEAYEFRYLRRHVPAVQFRALTPVVKAATAVAPTRPHPGVDSATVNTLLGPALSIFDRTRDLVRKLLEQK
jgi:hemerythrin superfamily protein